MGPVRQKSLELGSMGAMGVCFGADLFRLEVDDLCAQEFAITADEGILWRRTKLGYLFSEQEVRSLSTYLDQCRRTQP